MIPVPAAAARNIKNVVEQSLDADVKEGCYAKRIKTTLGRTKKKVRRMGEVSLTSIIKGRELKKSKRRPAGLISGTIAKMLPR